MSVWVIEKQPRCTKCGASTVEMIVSGGYIYMHCLMCGYQSRRKLPR